MELATYLTEQGDLRACKGREADFKSAQKTNPVSKRDEHQGERDLSPGGWASDG